MISILNFYSILLDFVFKIYYRLFNIVQLL